MTRPARVVVVGDVITDVVAVLSGPLAAGSDTGAEISLGGGGQAANTAAWVAAQRVDVTLIGAVGNDDAGRDRVAELDRAGVDCAIERVEGAPTGTVIVLAADDERTMVSQRGANLRLSATHVEQAVAAVPDAGHLHLSAYTLLDAESRGAGLRALAAARERG
ncbi:carbohydrate kinase family protein, partial [Micromonospora foliorum]|uniref:carbohydrate kinase family protein n=1 Tax=Micromonospora foliorum TaxID=2911210 RepID=UPI001EE7A288